MSDFANITFFVKLILMHNISERRHRFFKSFEAQSLRSRSILTQLADDLTAICGSTKFLILHIIWFSLWIGINSGVLPLVEPFDPFPFGLLTMVVSLEAIFLAIFILVSQNRQSYVSALREEVHLRINLIAEEEVTKALEVLGDIKKHLGVKKDDPELEEMLKRIDTNYIEQLVEEEITRANKPIAKKIIEEAIKKPIEIVEKKIES